MCLQNLQLKGVSLQTFILQFANTAILYRASTGPEQGFPCEVFHTGKNLFSLQGTPVLIAGTPVFITGNGFAVY